MEGDNKPSYYSEKTTRWLSYSEVSFIIENFVKQARKSNDAYEPHPTIKSFMDYFQKLGYTNDNTRINEIRENMSKINNGDKIPLRDLKQIWNLRPSTSDEAVALVKELDNVDDQLVNKLIDTLEEL
mmetsp:Transcript_41258/g.47913  ORF Transcript_41258/g.47913 Transcript_41258/m.47913 type:complete len:127 (+) Transcript_41258:38-418(+)